MNTIENETDDEKQEIPAEESLRGDVIRAVVALGCLGAVVSILGYGLSLPGVVRTSPPLVDVKTTKGTVREICGPPSRDGRPVPIEMLYSDDKQTWIEEAANSFARICPNIQVKLTAMGDIESADAIMSGSLIPTLWSPADELVVRYLEYRKSQNKSAPPIQIGAPTSIVHSPLVVLVWREQERVLDSIAESISRAGKTLEGPWARVACARMPRDPDLSKIALEDMVPGRWIDWYKEYAPPPPTRVQRPAQKKDAPDYQPPFPTLEEIRDWGRVKFVHASPTRSAAGLEALYMMAYDYVLPPSERTAAKPPDVTSAEPNAPTIQGSEYLHADFQRALSKRKDALRRWLRRCEAGLGVTPRSAKLLTDTMFYVGPSRYHFVATYEHLIFSVMDQVNQNASVMDNLRVIYPQPTIVNQHPVVSLLPEGSEHDRERDASQRWIGYLRSPEIQRRAIELGFRPAVPEVMIRDHRVSENPFLRLRRYGVSFESPLREPPRLDGKTVHELIDLWEDATGRN